MIKELLKARRNHIIQHGVKPRAVRMTASQMKELKKDLETQIKEKLVFDGDARRIYGMEILLSDREIMSL